MKKRLVRGGALSLIGYLLSPLSWWNDLFVNLPIAYVFASIFAIFSKNLFLPLMILGYWLTNVAGILLMHHGVNTALSKKRKAAKISLIDHLLLSTAYTALVVIFVELGWLKFPMEYFAKK